jgi:hypothetical protein
MIARILTLARRALALPAQVRSPEARVFELERQAEENVVECPTEIRETVATPPGDSTETSAFWWTSLPRREARRLALVPRTDGCRVRSKI